MGWLKHSTVIREYLNYTRNIPVNSRRGKTKNKARNKTKKKCRQWLLRGCCEEVFISLSLSTASLAVNQNYNQSNAKTWRESSWKQHLINAFNEMNYHQIKSRGVLFFVFFLFLFYAAHRYLPVQSVPREWEPYQVYIAFSSAFTSFLQYSENIFRFMVGMKYLSSLTFVLAFLLLSSLLIFLSKRCNFC